MSMTDSSAELPAGEFSGPQAFAQLIRLALEHAAQAGWNEMVWSDPTYEDWPLRERAVAAALDAWAGPGRKLVMLAHRYDSIERLHARFVTWRIRWDHIVECRICRQVSGSDFPSALWTPHWMLRRLDVDRSRGVCSFAARERVELRQQLDECRRQSIPGFPSTKLGL
jgi:hypothetical protein